MTVNKFAENGTKLLFTLFMVIHIEEIGNFREIYFLELRKIGEKEGRKGRKPRKKGESEEKERG